MSYLAPPPMPAPVVVTKDVGGFVADYQAQTEIYRASDREVRLHECRSACTMALSLPNVCVYPDSILKFHLAYDIRNHQTDANISKQLFDSYPPTVRERLGVLTREYKVLRGSELIELGIRNCNEERVMVAATAPRKTPPAPSPAEPQAGGQGSFLGGLMHNMLSMFGGSDQQAARASAGASRMGAPKVAPTESILADPPLPPPRPVELAASVGSAGAQIGAASPRAPEAETADASRPQSRPINVTYSYAHRLGPAALPKIITGAQRILPPGFSAYAPVGR